MCLRSVMYELYGIFRSLSILVIDYNSLLISSDECCILNREICRRILHLGAYMNSTNLKAIRESLNNPRLSQEAVARRAESLPTVTYIRARPLVMVPLCRCSMQ